VAIGALLDWIKAQPDLDENKVMVMGGPLWRLYGSGVFNAL
jgi:hypothetical protein